MEPTLAEVIFWCLAGAGALIFLIILLIANTVYIPDDDPYRFCPKEDEEN